MKLSDLRRDAVEGFDVDYRPKCHNRQCNKRVEIDGKFCDECEKNRQASIEKVKKELLGSIPRGFIGEDIEKGPVSGIIEIPNDHDIRMLDNGDLVVSKKV